MKSQILFGMLLGFGVLLYACKQDQASQAGQAAEKSERAVIPAFDRDSAYYFIEKQLTFGPRVPGSEGHIACREWIIDKLESYGAQVERQNFTAKIYTGESLPATNIIAQFNPGHKERVILSAHWDSRFMAEEDQDRDRRNEPIPGADDAGSGVAVLIEIARQIAQAPIDMGIDIILWDAEDQGQRGQQSGELSWCLGSQYWSRNKHSKKYQAKYGINLDMVGGKNARFPKEGVSMYYAPKVMNKIWKLARTMGYSDMFVDEETGGITDDHKFVNEIAGIPMIDIINLPKNTKTSFASYWHTHDDDIDNIDKRTLKAVGQVVLAAIYKESDGSIASFE